MKRRKTAKLAPGDDDGLTFARHLFFFFFVSIVTLIVNFLVRSIHNVFLYILWPVACMSLFFLTILCIKSCTPKHATTQHGESRALSSF